MHIQKNILISGLHGKPIATDIFYRETLIHKPIVIYAHGFNGFKDWANFDIIAKQFAEAGFLFVKFNFSHNGTTPKYPEDFKDLEAYANNNYTLEMDDLGTVIQWVLQTNQVPTNEIDKENLFLIGHSLGGGIVLLKASEDFRVKAVSGWASISECKTPWGNWPEEKMKQWQQDGVAYITNSRTKQDMPLKFQLYENFRLNKERLDIQKAIKNLSIPVLICHGSSDTSVPVEKAHNLKSWQPSAELFIVASDHVFGRKHPWTEDHLPEAMQSVVNETIRFFKKSAL
jgi:predicted dienelactone hydrolase